jgi:hypothetical protein
MALPDDLPPDRDSKEEHPRRFVHGYHLLDLSHGLDDATQRTAVTQRLDTAVRRVIDGRLCSRSIQNKRLTGTNRRCRTSGSSHRGMSGAQPSAGN